MLQVGSLVDNKYKILSEVGHGGMSVVYLAINERANKTWAVKEVRKDGVCNFEAVKQGLVVETDMLKKLDHPHLPSIIDVIDSDESFLIVMDYIEGKSLQNVLKNSGAQPQELVIKWSMQLCDVLGYLHSRTPSIIYRDMKPANVMLKPSGDITLIDFGTAREFKDRSMVEDTTCLGTRGYAAPEQFGGRGQTDPRTDIYCLGATMYHLLTGHSPAEPPYEIKPLSYWDPAYYGTGLEQIINKCCQQDPNVRYQSCAELMYDLEHVHDMDLVTQRKRKQKWRAFVASVVVCAVGVAGMLGCHFAKNAAVAESYNHYIDMAERSTAEEQFKEFVGYIQDAIAVDPGNYEAYDLLLKRIEEDATLDEINEWPAVVQCLSSTTGGTVTNDTYLLRADKEGYADVQFRVGKLLFLMGDGDNDNLRRSAYYFRKALDDGGMAQSEDQDIQYKAAIAESLAKIGESVEQLNANSLYGESEYSFTDLWNDLEGLIDTYGIGDMGSRAYGIALYNRVAFMVSTYYADFASMGIQRDQMLALLDRIQEALEQTRSALTTAEINRHFDVEIETALNNVLNARNKISSMKGDPA